MYCKLESFSFVCRKISMNRTNAAFGFASAEQLHKHFKVTGRLGLGISKRCNLSLITQTEVWGLRLRRRRFFHVASTMYRAVKWSRRHLGIFKCTATVNLKITKETKITIEEKRTPYLFYLKLKVAYSLLAFCKGNLWRFQFESCTKSCRKISFIQAYEARPSMSSFLQLRPTEESAYFVQIRVQSVAVLSLGSRICW